MKEKLWQHGKIIIASTIFIVIVSVLMEGMWLPGIPKIEDVQSVAVTDLRHSTEAKEFSDGKSIELAVKLSSFLKYKPLSSAQGPSEPVVTITYYLKDGSSQSLSANENTVWWKAKTHQLKQEEIFLNLSEGIFFYEEAIAADQAKQ